MGDSARIKRREQLKRWHGSCTDKASPSVRPGWRSDAENGPGDPKAELSDLIRDHSGSVGTEETGPLRKAR